jgi:lysosomal Pro-X carboxypeptidase
VSVTADIISSWLENAWVNTAMVDYPYHTSFLVPLPPWPVREECVPV